MAGFRGEIHFSGVGFRGELHISEVGFRGELQFSVIGSWREGGAEGGRGGRRWARGGFEGESHRRICDFTTVLGRSRMVLR